MTNHRTPTDAGVSETGSRVNAVREWRSTLTCATGAALLFLTVTGLSIYLLPFSVFNQLGVLAHTVVGLATIAPIAWYLVRHWLVRRRGKLSHFQLLGYLSAVLLLACMVSGVVITWQGVTGPHIGDAWDLVHLVTGITVVVFVVVHLATVVIRKVNNPEARRTLVAARRAFYRRSVVTTVVLVVVAGAGAVLYPRFDPWRPFPDDYNWSFGEDRPFAPSLARVDLSDRPDHAHSAVVARAMAGSAGCGTSGCHSEIYEEWLPSAHRYSSMDDMFQKVQEFMAVETSPEHTRYCAGCHDPISLFSGAKNSSNITLSAEGADEGSSCVVCHSIVQTDVQGNGDYTLRPPVPYVGETYDGRAAKLISDFLIRTYPDHHVASYARPLYKTAEFCGACHKQYLDKEVNTDIGKVQGQNQYDSWKNSRWYHEGEPEKTLSCRECHMPLIDSDDPARGDETDFNRTPDDRMHRGHRMLASNQYIPLVHDLEGAEEHVRLTEQWLRGEIEIPEIADRWTTGPVVRLTIAAPERVTPGATVPVQVILTNNKTGHDFPTGPLDMIESWIELTVTADDGTVLYHEGGLDERGAVADTSVWFKADDFDRKGELIDRHNLWDMVGASYKRTLYPGVTDTMRVEFQCPSMARGRVSEGDERIAPGQRLERFDVRAPSDVAGGTIHVDAVLWYRKANPEFLDRVYGADANVRSPITEISRTTATIEVVMDGQASAQ